MYICICVIHIYMFYEHNRVLCNRLSIFGKGHNKVYAYVYMHVYRDEYT
jgi:hypothetical protein